MNKKALILTWEGYQDQEVIYPYYRLLEDNFIVDILSEKLGTIYGIMGTKMESNFPSCELNNNHLQLYDFLVIPGGVKALEKLRQQTNVLEFINKWVNLKKIVASTCHGAQLLISSKVTLGRKISGYYSIKDDITNSGAEYVDKPFVIDDPIISSPHYKHMGPWIKAALDLYYLKNESRY